MIKDNVRFLVVSMAAGLLLAGCGGSDDETSSAPDKNTNTSSAEEKGATKLAKARKCPAKVKSGKRADGAPVDDIVNLRSGMSYDDAEWVLSCRDDVSVIEMAEKWNIKQNYGFPTRQIIRATNGTPCTGQEIVRDMSSVGGSKKCEDGGYGFKSLKDITQEYRVAFSGLQGEEKVGAVWRRSVFQQGEAPAVETLLSSLNDKYGAPHATDKDKRGMVTLSWIYDVLGRPMSKASNDFQGCKNSLQPSFNSSQRWSSNCGLSIRASVKPMYGNELLVQEMNIGVMHQKNFYEESQQFEQALIAANEQRKRDEAAEAASGAAPDL